MSIIRADSIKNRAGTGAPDFPNGITVTGIVTSTVLQNNITGDLTVSGNLGVGGTVTYEDVTNVDSLGVGAFRDGLRVTGICTATAFHGNGSALTGIDATALKDGSGNVIVQASASAVSVTAGKHFNPASTNSTDLGTTSLRWRNIYTNDLNLSNEGSSNDFDGSWGDWTIQEGESDLFLKNNRSGKKYKFNLTEVS